MIIPRRKPFFADDLLLKSLKLLVKPDYEEVKKLEKDLSIILKIPNPVVISSGRIGLRLILETTEIKKGSEIIIPGYTFGILTKTIRAAGFIPKPVDISRETFQMSPEKIKEVISKKTGAILATHLLGEPCEIEKIKIMAKKNKILLIEDSAQSLGATKKGKLVGTFGDVSISSFNIAKPLQGITGGLIFGKNKKLIEKIRKRVGDSKPQISDFTIETFRSLLGYFLSQTILWPMIMFTFSFRSLQEAFVKMYRGAENKKSFRRPNKRITSVSLHPMFAYILRMNLHNFNERLKRRRLLRSLYLKRLNKYVNFQKIDKGNKGTVDMLVATIDKSVLEARRYLSLRGIDIAIMDEIADDILKEKESNTECVLNSTIALPIYESMSKGDIIFVSKTLKQFLSSK